MAATLPLKLKIKDITPFAVRAAQLEKYKPIVSYWCNYYIIDQILSKGLHNADNECMQYTTTLMDKLEQTKTEQAGNDAITDDVAAKAYIEQFALDTFKKGDDAIHTNNASRQTIDTFQAAVTFFELLTMSIWAPMDPEIASKIKYSKFHAVRIAKAIKAGEDPNASNPVDDPVHDPLDDPVHDHPVDEEPLVEESLATQLEQAGGAYGRPTFEGAPESKQPSRPSSITQSMSFASTPAPPPATQPEDQPSPIDNPRQNSVGGGYFPDIPTFTSESAAPSTSTADETTPFAPSAPPTARDAPSPSDYYSHPSQPPAPTQVQPKAPVAPLPTSIPPVQALPPGGYRIDDDSMMLAQKHAKWAMSALNFEDVETAVKELRLALHTLGAN